MESTRIDVNVGWESEYADTGVMAIRLIFSEERIKRLREVISIVKDNNLLLAEIGASNVADFLDEEGEPMAMEHFRIGYEYFRIYSGGVYFVAENKHDPDLRLESEVIIVNDDLTISLPDHDDNIMRKDDENDL